MLARDLMTSNPATVTPGDTLQHAAALMRLRGVGMLPVVTDQASRRLVGVLTDRDLVVRHLARANGPTGHVADCMTHLPLATVGPEASVEALADLMVRHQVRRLPVVDTHGALLGVVAQADLAIHVGRGDARLVEQVLEGVSRPAALVH
ncbi:MAG: CBS domain-containing protein [Gemmatimonadetes bacterium]|nr:CBS domain-containing protein [Gemmatimonadota bacterium]